MLVQPPGRLPTFLSLPQARWQEPSCALVCHCATRCSWNQARVPLPEQAPFLDLSPKALPDLLSSPGLGTKAPGPPCPRAP